MSLEKYTFSPAELSSERGEKEVLADSKQPTAPPSTKSHASYCAARARQREKMAAEGTSSKTGRSLLQSVLVSAVNSCHCPHPSHPSTALLPIVSLSLSLSFSLSPTRFDAFKDVIVLIVHNMLPVLGEQPRHLGYWPVNKESIGINKDLTKDRNMNTFKMYCKRRKSSARFPDKKAKNRLYALHCIAGNVMWGSC